MAYRRSLTTTRAKLFVQQGVITPSISSYVNHKEDRKNHRHSNEKVNLFLQSRSYGVLGNKTNTGLGFGGSGMSFRDAKWSQFIDTPPPMTTSGSGFLVARNMSTSIGNGAEKIDYMTNMTDILADQTMEAVSTQAAAVSEVAVAAADSWLPVAALQYAIDGIHIYTGLNWWAAIVITTLIFKTLSLPLMIHRLKATSKLSNLRPKIEEIKQDIDYQHVDQYEGTEQMQRLFKEHGVSPFTPFMGMVMEAPFFITFFVALQNMVEKVPSFKTGGVSWFLDLTTADPFYILPCLSGFIIWLTVEFGMQEGMEGKSNAALMKNVSRGLAALSIPFSASFPQAIFCYWISSSLFSLAYGLIIKQEEVKKFLNIPKIVPPPPSLYSQSSFGSPFEAFQKYIAEQVLQQQRAAGISKPGIANQSITSSLLSQRPTLEQKSANGKIRNLEKKVKERKKNKRR